jgi:DNA-binding response OmpR family regulator
MKDATKKVLLVEDELTLAEIIKESLETRDFSVTLIDSIAAGIDAYYHTRPDIIVLDVMLPDGDGFTMAAQIRQTDMNTPIIFLTSKSLPSDVVKGFESGGNDYMKKPFSIEELIVRMKVLLNKNRVLPVLEAHLEEVVQIGAFTFNYNNAVLLYAGISRQLTSRESELLKVLYVNKNRLIDRKSLLKSIWGDDDFFSGRSLDVFITKLRKYLQHDPAVKILNIRGIGYKLIC